MYDDIPSFKLNRAGISGIIVIAVLLLIAIGAFFAVVVIAPNERGIPVVLGDAADTALQPGVSVVAPFITQVKRVDVSTQRMKQDFQCFSSDLQTVTIAAVIIYRPAVDNDSIRSIITQYQGLDRAVTNILVPNLAEALKESTAVKTAETAVKVRENIKKESLQKLRERVKPYGIFNVEDVIIENIDLSNELERAIEAKMVQEQEAAKAKFTQEKARIDAETAIIAAKGEAESLSVKGEALRKNPEILTLEGIQKWDGRTPQTLVVNGGNTPAAFSTILPPNAPTSNSPQPARSVK